MLKKEKNRILKTHFRETHQENQIFINRIKTCRLSEDLSDEFRRHTNNVSIVLIIF